MRLSFYEFPEGTDEDILLREGCAVILKNGTEIYPSSISDDKRPLVDHVSRITGPCSITAVKERIKKYGGCGWTEHYERDGGLFETTPIGLCRNNSHFTYNRHL